MYIRGNPYWSVAFRIASVIIRSSTYSYVYSASVSDYGNWRFRCHPWDIIRSRTGEVIRECVTWALRYVAFCHVLLRSPRSTTAHLSRSIPPWLPWQFFWLFKNLSRRSRQPRRATFVDPFPYVVLRSPRFAHGGRNRDCRGRQGHSVNVA